jgi:phenylacetate-CoA ligase
LQDIIQFRELQRQARLGQEELRELQESRLRGLVQQAYCNVPYYRRLFDRAGLHWHDIRTLDDLQRIPITTRRALQLVKRDDRLDQRTDRRRISVSRTSGSTGRPLEVYLTPEEYRTRRMVQFRCLLDVGMRWRDRLLQLGFPVCPPAGWHQRLGLFRAECLDQFMPPPEQYRRILEVNPKVLWAYPSTFLAVVESGGRPLNEWLSPRLFIMSAETMPPVLAQRIDTELDTELFNFYGSVEAGRIAHECQTHEGLHVLADQVILECVCDGRPVPVGKSGSVLITLLGIRASPIIRYELGDIAPLLGKACSCGSAFPLMGPPEGRTHELMVLPSGQTLSQLVALRLVGQALPGTHFQIIQHGPDHIEILFVNDSEDGSSVARRVRELLVTKLDEPMLVDARRVDRIAIAGKFRAFIRNF